MRRKLLFPALLLLGLIPGAALARQGDGQADQYRQMGLEAVPFKAESIGLSLHLPISSSIRIKQNGEHPVFVVEDASLPNSWRLQIESVELSTVAERWADADAFLNQILARQTDYQVLTRESPRIFEIEARLCYIQRMLTDDSRIVTGWLVLPSGRSSLIVISISSQPDTFPDLKSLLDNSFSTIRLKTEEQRNIEQRARIENGRELLASLTPERLRGLVGLRQWFRTYRPVPDGATGSEIEVACSLVEILEAKRGALKPDQPEERYTLPEQEEGLMIRVQGRVIVNPERGVYYDTLALFWMAWDQSCEAWSVLGTHRQGQASQTETETGLRNAPSVGDPAPRLIVIRTEPTPYEWDVPEVYLSQPLAWLLGHLMPRTQSEPAFYCYYFYNARSMSPNISLRYDRWEPLDDGTGNWQLATLLDKNQPPDVTIYDPDGVLVRRTRPTGDVTIPTTREQLLRLWRSKGLRTGPSSP